MKKRFSLLLLFGLVCTSFSRAGVTTYSFTSAKWGSVVGAIKCDNKTDGWISDKDAGSYSEGRMDANDALYSRGVGVTTGYSEAGATSVKSFTKVRKIVVNFCQNSSKGKGVIYFQIGENDPDSLVVNKPAQSGQGVYNRDSVITIAQKTGKIKFWIKCSENAIYLNSLTIRSEEGGTNPFTETTYQLVTGVEQLEDSDQVIIGIADGTTNKIMGYFDETISQNNIHAISGRYSADRTMVEANDGAIYTLRKTTNKKGEAMFLLIDELRYDEAYLVASGGQTKNRLALWTNYESPNYGEYGIWSIEIAPTGEAQICSQGTSLGKYISYNASDKLFGCYNSPERFVKPCIYRRTTAIGTDKPAISAQMVNFGELCLRGETLKGQREITVNAIHLTGDIEAKLVKGDVFTVSTSSIDRDGDQLTISYQASVAGNYIDTLRLSAPETTIDVPIMLHVVAQMTIAQAQQQADFASTYLGDVVVTKKYDKYIFIRDATGSMLIYDAVDAQGKPYGKGLKNGDVLRNVHGRFQNYYGVPEITPVEAWIVGTAVTCAPEAVVGSIDSSSVCKYVRISGVVVENRMWEGMPVVGEAFNVDVMEDVATTMDAIVMITHDVVELWVVHQEIDTPSELDEMPMGNTQWEKILYNGQIYLHHDGKIYTIEGQPMCNQ